ncbi:MAG: NADH-quinone oxidoreductase subunit H [Acidobacteriota bacterium]|nr:NADH-quinone oxidoreductase subunit H [Acidobacteriota bacterium]
MVPAFRILGTAGIDLLNGFAIIAFLLLGLVCIAIFDRKVARSLAPQPVLRGADFPELLQALTVSIRSYARGLLAQDAGRFLPWLASIISVAGGIVAFAALSFGPAVYLADLDTGLIFIIGASFLGILGGVLARGFSARGASLAGVARNGMRVASFEAASALALISGIILAGSLSVRQVVQAQLDQGAWFFFLAPLGFALYLASSIAGIDSAARPPVRAASKTAQNGPDRSGIFRWPFGSLGASIHLLVGAGLASTVFMGGWLRPFASYHDHFAGTPIELLDALPPVTMVAATAYCRWLSSVETDPVRKRLMKIASGTCAALFVVFAGILFAPAAAIAAVHGAFWFAAKMAGYIYAFLWLRARIPQFRFGRSIRGAWNFLIPVAAINAAAVAAALVARERWDWSPAASMLLTTLFTLLFAVWLGLHDAGTTSAYRLEP